MSDRIDYQALAERLRRVSAQRSARADAQRDAKVEQGGVPLDDVLNVLDGPGAAGLVDAVQARTRQLLAESRARFRAAPEAQTRFSVFVDDAFLPSDAFDKRMVAFFDRQRTGEVPRDLVARAIVTALADATDHGGVLVDGAVAQVLGPRAALLLRDARALMPAFGPQPATTTTTRPKLKFEELDHLTADKVARSRSRSTLVARMPVLGEVTRQRGGPQALAGFTMASVQHLFPSTLGLFDALGDNGLPRSTLGVGGKNYSSNPDLVARMAADGWDVHHDAKPRPQEAGLDAERLVYDMAVDELARLFKGTDLKGTDPGREVKRRFLLLDEGGKLIKALHEEFPQYAHLCVAVEQTDRGIQIIEDMARRGLPLRCPVVDMARSVAKKTAEAPMIGESVAFHLEHELDRMGPGLRPAPLAATIIGYGAVGKATADALKRRGYSVVVWDTDPAKMAQAAAEGCTAATSRDQALARGHLLVGCTGQTVLRPAEFDLLPDGAVLVNAASGNHELGLHDIGPRWFDQHDATRTTAADGTVHSVFRGKDVSLGAASEGEAVMNRVVRTPGGKELVAIRSGYVVNMTLGLPPEYVQLTLGLLLGSCLQAVGEARPGLVKLDAGLQRQVVDGTRARLRDMGHDLDRPDFAPLAAWQ